MANPLRVRGHDGARAGYTCVLGRCECASAFATRRGRSGLTGGLPDAALGEQLMQNASARARCAWTLALARSPLGLRLRGDEPRGYPARRRGVRRASARSDDRRRGSDRDGVRTCEAEVLRSAREQYTRRADARRATRDEGNV